MAIPREIEAEAGDLILPKWKALIDFARSTGIVRHPDVIVKVTPHGTRVVPLKRRRRPRHPFRVSATSTGAVVRAGTVNGVSPYIGRYPISGIDPTTGVDIEVPPLEIKHAGEARTYVALYVKPEGESGLKVQDDPELTKIVHVVDPGDLDGTSPDVEGATTYPLAALYWSDRGVLNRAFQIVHHNLSHRFLEGRPEEGIGSRHIFWAA